MNCVIVGVGSNIRPEENITLAIRELEKSVKIIRKTGLMRTAPIGITDQPDFINGALLVETPMGIEQMKTLLKGLEDLLGRDRTLPKFGPRIIDLDLLAWNGEILDKDYYTRDFLRKLVDELTAMK